MNKHTKKKLTRLIALMLLIFSGCDSNDSVDTTNHVTITENPLYWEIHIDYSYGDRYWIGHEYGTKVLSTIPDYEVGGDAYLQASVTGLQGAVTYEVLIERALEISKNIQDRYMDEMEGFASVLSGGLNNTLGDGKLSRDEYLMLNLIPDIFNTTACSATTGPVLWNGWSHRNHRGYQQRRRLRGRASQPDRFPLLGCREKGRYAGHSKCP
ncbi:MAG: hypothetical protein B6240_12280 [Desulfobacteraceae bacterium 4572_87]|nr:MAG: hypothetical protein B6240_12280 [Desulfobacteraceae bacterium 4572_87]